MGEESIHAPAQIFTVGAGIVFKFTHVFGGPDFLLEIVSKDFEVNLMGARKFRIVELGVEFGESFTLHFAASCAGLCGETMAMNELEQNIKELIVEALMLDDVTPAQIETDAPLFVEGLGLDSIDALELAMAIDKKFGVRIRADDEQNRQIFASVKSLAAYVAEHQKPVG